MIPKIFHQTWLGNDPMPQSYIELRNTWLKYHPDWKAVLWTKDNMPKLVNKHIYDQLNNLGAKSDLVRYEVLYQYGGWYADGDTQCFKSIDELLNGLDIALMYEPAPPRTDLIANCFMGSVPYHPFFRKVLEELPYYAFRTDWPVVGATGPKFLGLVAERFPVEVKLNRDHFLPFMFDEKHRRHEHFPNAYAVHYWDMSWMGSL